MAVAVFVVDAYGFEDEECVKERGKERYCWREGVMSRNEGEERETLLI